MIFKKINTSEAIEGQGKQRSCTFFKLNISLGGRPFASAPLGFGGPSESQARSMASESRVAVTTHLSVSEGHLSTLGRADPPGRLAAFLNGPLSSKAMRLRSGEAEPLPSHSVSKGDAVLPGREETETSTEIPPPPPNPAPPAPEAAPAWLRAAATLSRSPTEGARKKVLCFSGWYNSSLSASRPGGGDVAWWAACLCPPAILRARSKSAIGFGQSASEGPPA